MKESFPGYAEIACVHIFTGIIGNISFVAYALYLIDLAGWFRMTWRPRSPASLLAACLNCMLWVLFGLPFVHSSSIFVLTGNLIGCFIIVVYLLFFATYKSSGYSKHKVITILMLEISAVVLIAAMALSVTSCTKFRSRAVVIMAIICHIGWYAFPLSETILVIRTRNMEHVDKALVLASFIHCNIWFVYAGFPMNLYLLAPYAVGAILGRVQIILFMIAQCFDIVDIDCGHSNPSCV